jgi:hypothetical protein
MKFEIMSFLGALTVYVVRLRVRHINDIHHHVYSNGFMGERAHLFIPTMSPGHPRLDSRAVDASSQPSQGSSTNRDEHRSRSGSRMAWDAFLDSGSRPIAGAIRGCGKAVALSAFYLLLRILTVG